MGNVSVTGELIVETEDIGGNILRGDANHS